MRRGVSRRIESKSRIPTAYARFIADGHGPWLWRGRAETLQAWAAPPAMGLRSLELTVSLSRASRRVRWPDGRASVAVTTAAASAWLAGARATPRTTTADGRR